MAKHLPAELKAEIDRILFDMGDITFGVKKELFELPEILNESEKLIALCSGLLKGNTWVIVLTSQRLLFLDKGMFWGLKMVAIPLRKVTSTSSSTGLMFGKIFVAEGTMQHEISMVTKSAVPVFHKRLQVAIETIETLGA
jgi:Bacterial PH domain